MGRGPEEVAFTLLEHLLAQPGVRLQPNVRAIDFEFLPLGNHWSFDPDRKANRFAPSALPDAPLHLRLTPDLLLRLLVEPDFQPSEDDLLLSVGDPDTLTALLASLASKPEVFESIHEEGSDP